MAALGLSDAVLADLVEQSFIADLENRCRLLTVPVRLLQSLGDGLGLGFIFGSARQRFQAARVRPTA